MHLSLCCETTSNKKAPFPLADGAWEVFKTAISDLSTAIMYYLYDEKKKNT